MSRTLDEFRAARPLAPTRAPDPQRLGAAVHEAVRMEALTGDPNWDHFLAYLEAHVKAAERHRDFEFAKLRDPLLVNDEQIRLCKAKIALIEGRIAALKDVLALPKLLHDHGAAARARIAEMTRDAA